jgi:hypothetical protein
MRQPLVWRGEAGLVLDGAELGDPIERRFGDGPLGGLLSESLAQSLWEQLDEPTRRARDPGAADCPRGGGGS